MRTHREKPRGEQQIARNYLNGKSFNDPWMAALFMGVMFAFVSRAGAAVTVKFEQIGNDVVATWNGTLDLGGVRTYPWSVAAAARASSREMFSGFNGSVDIWTGGSAQSTALTFSIISSRTPSAAEWGFSESDFTLGPSMSTIGLTMIDFGTGSDYTLTWNNVTLSAIGAGSFNNTLAWTSPAGDTISYTTIPEPGASLLCILGTAAALSRRRRVGYPAP